MGRDLVQLPATAWGSLGPWVGPRNVSWVCEVHTLDWVNIDYYTQILLLGKFTRVRGYGGMAKTKEI